MATDTDNIRQQKKEGKKMKIGIKTTSETMRLYNEVSKKENKKKQQTKRKIK